MPNPTAPVATLAETAAEVRVGELTTRYRRSGSGRPVVLLHDAREPDGLSPELAELLSTRFRVIVPELPSGDVDLAAWLRDFLEALGIERAAVLVPGHHGISSLELALLDAE